MSSRNSHVGILQVWFQSCFHPGLIGFLCTSFSPHILRFCGSKTNPYRDQKFYWSWCCRKEVKALASCPWNMSPSQVPGVLVGFVFVAHRSRVCLWGETLLHRSEQQREGKHSRCDHHSNNVWPSQEVVFPLNLWGGHLQDWLVLDFRRLDQAHSSDTQRVRWTWCVSRAYRNRCGYRFYLDDCGCSDGGDGVLVFQSTCLCFLTPLFLVWGIEQYTAGCHVAVRC